MIDGLGRTIDYIRISITDRCNLRCVYCMPEGGVPSLNHSDILTYEEILRLVRLLIQLGVRHVRITGGEPTVRKNWLELVRSIRALPDIESIAMTTNGLAMAGKMQEVRSAGIDGINLSIDALDDRLYRRIARGGSSADVLSVVRDATSLGMCTKVNAVPVRGLNEGELPAIAALAKDLPICVRFIELMPVGCGANLTPVPSDEVLSIMESAFGKMEPDGGKHGFGPAKYFKPHGFMGSIGVISPLSHEFCDQCNRIRLTSDGFMKLCLNHRLGLDLRAMLRSGADDAALLEAMRDAILCKPARHGFREDIGDRESRRMNEIGG